MADLNLALIGNGSLTALLDRRARIVGHVKSRYVYVDGLAVGEGDAAHLLLGLAQEAHRRLRADPQGQNKGGGAAAAALHLIALKRRWNPA